MLLNENTVLICSNIALFPYDKCHVERYHEWMTDPEILTLTASEPLTLEAEYDMQRSWRLDNDSKSFRSATTLSDVIEMTFIISTPRNGDYSLEASTHSMIGDVNMFLHRNEDDVSPDNVERSNIQDEYTGELELMIAEKSARRQGHGRAALLLFMAYILLQASHITNGGRLTAFTVKIGHENTPSLGLFQALGFRKLKYSDFFREWELSLPIEAQTLTNIKSLMSPNDVEWQERRLG